jgi:hypothetical protein
MVTAVLTHLAAEQVHERMQLLNAVAPDARFVICYGGTAEEFERIELQHRLLIDDPTLRGPQQHLQSLTMSFAALWNAYFEHDESSDSLYLVEYDHLILDRQFETRLRELAAVTNADFMGKTCTDRTGTNGEHYVRFRSDPRILGHLHKLSVREDPTRIFGCLGDGMWMSRGALQAYLELDRHPPCYCETYVPTLLHHLGYRVVDVDTHSDLYRHVRWMPSFDAEQVVAQCRVGTVFMHPVKDPDAVRAAREALGL